MDTNKFISSLNLRINKKQFALIIILLILYLSFEPLWKDFYTSIVINNFLCYFNSGIITEIIFFAIIVIFIFFLNNKLKLNFQLSLIFLIVSIIIGLIYLYYRSDHNFLFYKLKSFSFINYFDIILLGPIFSITLVLKSIFIPKQKSVIGKGFITDAPLKDSGEDLYKRKDYAKQLANKLNETISEEALAVGINGEWGIGKTSFFDLLKRHIDKKSFIIVDFNPWGSINEENVIRNFFRTLLSEVRKYSSRLSLLINDYSDALSSVSGNTLVKSSLSIINKNINESLDQKFNEINKLLKYINKRIIIFIDDLDRLQKDEIVQVIKLIRNTANFNNTIFIVAYDRNYICGAFEELGKTNSLFYLEKIFQIELELPYIDSSILRKQLVELLKTNLSEKYYVEVENLYSVNTSKSYPYLDKFIKTLRDVNRFVNLFCFQFNQIQGEVSFTDYFNITLLRMKYPELVKILYTKQDILFDQSKKDDEQRLYLKVEKNQTYLSEYLKKRKDLNVSEDDLIIFDNAVRSLFGQPVLSTGDDDEGWSKYGMFFYAERQNNSIVFPNTFYRYFSNQIFFFDISDQQWSTAFELPYEDFVEQLMKWVIQGAREEIYLRLKMMKDFNDKEKFEKVIKAIFELSNYSLLSDINETAAWYDYDDLFSKLYQSDQIVNSYYSGDKEKYKRFLCKVLIGNPRPFSFTVGFIVHITNDLNRYRVFPIEQLDLVKINVRYLKKYLLKINFLDRQAWSLFYDCKYIRANEDRTIDHIVVDDAKEIMMKHFDKVGIEYFINSVVITIKEDRVGEPLYFISDGPKAVLDNFESIKIYVNKFEKSPLIDEFNTFFDKLKESNFQIYIPFEFKHIVIKR